MFNLLFATTTDTTGTTTTWYLIIMVAAVFVLTYFMSVRPQKKRQKEHQEMMSDLKKGDQIMTIGGFRATVFTVKEDELVVELVPSQTKVTITKQAVANKFVPEEKGE
jgi:preprotein translocase subunit YajC